VASDIEQPCTFLRSPFLDNFRIADRSPGS